MNKFGFISSIFSLILFFLQFIPLGLYYGEETLTNSWLAVYLGIEGNPWLAFHTKIPIELFNYEGKKLYVWGMISNGKLHIWYEIDLLTFFMLFVLTFLAGFLALIGCAEENKQGKKLMNINFLALLTVFLYSIIGIPVYSKTILDHQLGFMDIFFYLNFGFYMLLFDLILALIARFKHPTE